jgi:hypothetical protein
VFQAALREALRAEKECVEEFEERLLITGGEFLRRAGGA